MSNLPTASESGNGYISDYNVYQNFQDPIQTAPTIGDFSQSPQSPSSAQTHPYPSWCKENGSMFTDNEIYDMFKEVALIFGFQEDNMLNMFDHFMLQLDSRSSRMTCPMALLSLHTHYIGGSLANYKRWYFAAAIDEEIGPDVKVKYWSPKSLRRRLVNGDSSYSLQDLSNENSYLGLEYKWKTRMNTYSEKDYVYQISLWLLIWGECNNVRYLPECLCFIFSCAFDHFYRAKSGDVVESRPFRFLDEVVTPLYNFMRDQQYDRDGGNWVKNEKDHSEVIGYDDMNQCFWHFDSLKRIKLQDGTELMNIRKEDRFLNLAKVDWHHFFRKTFWEKRTWMHVFSNFSRVWTIHVGMFWYFTCFNSPVIYTKDYDVLKDNKPPLHVRLSAVSFGGTIASLITFLGIMLEIFYVPRNYSGSNPILGRATLVFLILILNLMPSIYLFYFESFAFESRRGTVIAIVQFVFSSISFLYFSLQCPSELFHHILGESDNCKSSKLFTCSFPKQSFKSQFYSSTLWICVFTAKFLESYFFLTLSLKDPIKFLFTLDITRCHGDVYFQDSLCKLQGKITLVLLLVTDLVLFFLDTYLWYIICNCIFSIGLSFSSGISIFTPWKNIFSRLPERIATKIIFAKGENENNLMLKVSCVWNSIILSLYREHLISIEQVSKLVYQQVDAEELKSLEISTVKPPLFFIIQGDNSVSLGDFFASGKEAERRISFFAQSISIPLSESSSIRAAPTFTVLIPHYSERIILGLKETIKEDKNAKVSLLDYLKELHSKDWDSFVKDAKIWQSIQTFPGDGIDGDDYSAQEVEITAKENPTSVLRSQIEDLPFYSIGFKKFSPDHIMRTRIWASLRYQTLYRTVSGFMNYETAIRTLDRVECHDPNFSYHDLDDVEREAECLSKRKFHLLLSLQRFQNFSKEEKDDVYFLFQTFPNMKVAYLKKIEIEDQVCEYYSVMLDMERGLVDGEYQNKYMVKLSGNPILGDGKSDNQNHALIFHRGEYIQVVDANQDNYIEECLKIKTVLAEFEEMEIDVSAEYVPGILGVEKQPVAILGAREYIFSESIGVLGDIAAGKEQTFGTLFSRTMAEIGGKLHYGHPDFLNSIFMTTRGGISKAQKGLHLNEDIYAGMTVTCRGGKIKHCDYYQCGKGRDLGFGTILNFTAKIGAGMGEQMLSREHYYLGSSLPIDRFLTFYYAHPGFHINNVLIMLSIHLFMLVLVNLGALTYESIVCIYVPNKPFTDPQIPIGCYNIVPVIHWVARFILSIFICFFISFMPLIIQELVEKGILSSLSRIFYHFLSLAPFFEVFVCQIYAKSLRDNLVFGGAKYISTGRGFATVRLSFASLYSKYAEWSIYSGAEIFLIIVFATLSMWQFSLIWFWITIISMCLAPFIFNPHQFQWSEFFLDYREFIHWLSRGNSDSHKSSWFDFNKSKRSKFTGYKKYNLQKGRISRSRRPNRGNVIFGQVLIPLIRCLLCLTAFMFINAQNGVSDPKSVNPLFRIIYVSLSPFIFNLFILIAMGLVSHLMTPLTYLCKKSSPTIAALTHCLALLFVMLNMSVLLFLEGWNYTRSMCGFIFVLEMQKTICNAVFAIILSRELEEDESNYAWWSGKWYGRGLGWSILSQPWRELTVKAFELNSFTHDFLLGHCLLFAMVPCLFVPLVDEWHSSMLFWLRPSDKFRSPIYSQKQTRKRLRRVTRYSLLFFSILLLFVALAVSPVFAARYFPDMHSRLPESVHVYVQPNFQNNNYTSEAAY